MSINWEYVTERVRRYNENPSDDLLIRIGSHVDVLTLDDCDLIQKEQGGYLNPEQRYRVLDWIVGEARLEIEQDLAVLIFGREQLLKWLEQSRQAYPDFEFYLVFEAHQGQYTGHHGIDFTMHWQPRTGAPEPDVEGDFPWKVFWEWGEMFWGNYPGGFTNQFDFNLNCYPDQWSFATPNSLCVEGDRYTMLTDDEASLMSVASVLETTKVPA
jgi:hypothetical protein